MRVAILNADLPPAGHGGVAYQVDLLAETLSRRGHDVTVVTASLASGNRPFRTVVVAPRSHGPIRRQFGVGLAFRAIDLSGFDVIHAHGDDWGMRQRPLVRTFHGSARQEARTAGTLKRTLFESVNYGLEWVAKSRATVTTTVSEGTRRWLPGIEHVVPCAVDTEMFRPGEVRAEKPTILFVAGRIGGRKRGDLVLAAFRDVRRRLPDAHMIMVTRDRIAEPGVEVRSAVSARELGELYRSSWVLCSASTYEGFGVPYAEALLSGLAIVTTANAGAREVLQDGRLGDIVADDGLADGLVRMLTDPERSDRYRAIGLEAAQQYRADRVAARYEAIYEEAISRLRRSTGAGSRRR